MPPRTVLRLNMSTTINRATYCIRAGRALSFGLLIASGWIGANAGILLWTERADAVIAVFPGQLQLPFGVSLLAWDGRTAQLVGAERGYVVELYRHGALIVLPVRRHSCLPSSSAV